MHECRHRMHCLYATIRAREMLACGLLEQRDKKLQQTFMEREVIEGIPELPKGYKFTEWMRRAAACRCVCVCDYPSV